MWQTYRFPEDGAKKAYTLKLVALAVKFAVRMFRVRMRRRPAVRIFYATETGAARTFAEKLRKKFSGQFHVRVLRMSE